MESELLHVVANADYYHCTPDLVQALESFVDYLGVDVYITSGFRDGDPGQHGSGRAVDIVVPSMHLLDLYLAAEKHSAFQGIGVYPEWTYNGQTVGGAHLDVRQAPPARWMGIGHGKADTQYIALTQANLQQYGVI